MPLSEINVTPLVDVMLVLLVIFMVAAPMLTAGVSVALPKAKAPRMEINEKFPLITVRQDSRLFFYEEEVTMAALQIRLQEDQRVQNFGEVYVRADENVPYGTVARVLALVRQAGIPKMGLVTDPVVQKSVAEPKPSKRK